MPDVEILPIPASVILHPSSRVPFFSALLNLSPAASWHIRARLLDRVHDIPQVTGRGNLHHHSAQRDELDSWRRGAVVQG
jgi:hypothetical protein